MDMHAALPVTEIPPCRKCGKRCDGTERFWVAPDLSEAECDACHYVVAPGTEGLKRE